MMEKAVSCCFTGHRLEKLPWRGDENDPRCLLLKSQLEDAVAAVYAAGKRHYICGMATGCDMYFCQAVIDLRIQHPDITLEAAIPWEGQAKNWSRELKDRYYRLVAECDYQTLVHSEYTPDCMMRRNKYMVDSSSVLIAASRGIKGGTMNTMLYALRQGVEIIQLSIE